jgi:hypothetical protein
MRTTFLGGMVLDLLCSVAFGPRFRLKNPTLEDQVLVLGGRGKGPASAGIASRA